MKKGFSTTLYINFLVILLYTVVSLIYTDPLWRHFSEAIAGYGDVWTFYWSFWWFKKALTELFTNPFYPNYIFYPNGTCILLTETAVLHSVLSIPFQYLIGLIPSFNLFTLFSFVFSAWGTYLLVKYLTKNTLSSFMAGFIYGFWPWRMVKLNVGHHCLLCTEWIPFFVLFFIKIFEEKNRLNVFWAALFLALTFYAEPTYFVFLIFFGIFYFFLKLKKGLNFIIFKRLLVFSVVTIILMSPMFLPMLYEMSFVEYSYGKTDRNESDLFSADLISFFTPTYKHRFLSDQFEKVRKTFCFILDENSMYMGWLVIIVGLMTIIFVREQKLVFWKTAFIFFFMMALGHTLHIFCKNPFPGLYLPYEYFYRIPFINFSRAPSRIFVIGMLCFSVICGFGFNKFIDYLHLQKKFKIWIIYLLLVPVLILIFIDYYPSSPPISNPKQIFYYYSFFAKDKEDYATLTLPANFRPEDLGGQTVSEKRTVVGFTARTPKSAKEFLHQTPVLKNLIIQELFDKFDRSDIQAGKKLLNHYKIRYIILHLQPYSNEPGKSNLKKHLALLKEINAIKIFDDGKEMIFEIANEDNFFKSPVS
jgi:hypothetical protein